MDRRWLCIGWGVLFLSLAPGLSRGQCQTWSTQFDSAHVSGSGIYALKVFDDGTGSKLWVGGVFSADSGVDSVGKWDGQQWSPACCLPSVYALCVYDQGQGGQMYAGSEADPGAYGCVYSWDGSGWSLVGGGLGYHMTYPNGPFIMAMATYDYGAGPELYVGGAFDGSQTVLSRGLIRWNGTNWSSPAGGLATANGDVPYANILVVYNGELYAAGNFSSIGDATSPWIAKWNGSQWSSLGSGVNGQVTGMAVWDNGGGPKLYVSGTFTTAGGAAVSKVAIWDGSSWSPMPSPPISACRAMLPFDDGRGPALFVGAFANVDGMQAPFISRWDGTQWSSLGGGFGNDAECMASYDDGSGHGPDFYVGGLFTDVGGGVQSMLIARWIHCAGPTDSICPGDGLLAVCPCSTAGEFGHGCQNSANTGGALMSSSGSLSPDALNFSIAGELHHSLTILLQGDTPTNWIWPFGDGLRCIGGHLLRMFVTNAVNGVASLPGPTDLSITARAAMMGQPIPPGSIRLYQAYYRDSASACNTGFNVSNGARIVWPAF
jgi:hypothetical protein